MQLSEKTLNYINNRNLPISINSNFLITDLEKIIYTATFDSNDYYIYKSLSKDLHLLINTWNSLPVSEDTFIIKNEPNIKIITDDTENYSALMIFPIYLNNVVQRSCHLF